MEIRIDKVKCLGGLLEMYKCYQTYPGAIKEITGDESQSDLIVFDEITEDLMQFFFEKHLDNLAKEVVTTIATDLSLTRSSTTILETGTELKIDVLHVIPHTNTDVEPADQRIIPVVLFGIQNMTFMYSPQIFIIMEELQSGIQPIDSLYLSFLMYIYNSFDIQLELVNIEINELERTAHKTTGSKELYRLSDLKRWLVYLTEDINNLKETMVEINQNHDETDSFYNQLLLRQRTVEKKVALYEQLIENIGGLFSDMMSNHLNHIMKFLDSAALVVAVPALVGGLWGMNTGGLPGEKSELGFFVMMVIAFLLAILVALYLKAKDFRD